MPCPVPKTSSAASVLEARRSLCRNGQCRPSNGSMRASLTRPEWHEPLRGDHKSSEHPSLRDRASPQSAIVLHGATCLASIAAVDEHTACLVPPPWYQEMLRMRFRETRVQRTMGLSGAAMPCPTASIDHSWVYLALLVASNLELSAIFGYKCAQKMPGM